MNELTSGSRDDYGGQGKPGVSPRRGHDPIPGAIDVDGVAMAVDRCRDCGLVVLDARRPGGPCPGRNHTLTEFGVRPPADREREAKPSANGLDHGVQQGGTGWREESRAHEEATRPGRENEGDGTDTGGETPSLLTPR